MNNLFDRLGKSLKGNNNLNSCLTSKETIKFIELNAMELKKKEPYYDWKEIKDFLTKVSFETCMEINKDDFFEKNLY